MAVGLQAPRDGYEFQSQPLCWVEAVAEQVGSMGSSWMLMEMEGCYRGLAAGGWVDVVAGKELLVGSLMEVGSQQAPV